jgi:alanine-alpha-ketoisovalerate/valine-pyruvate aminotransferase
MNSLRLPGVFLEPLKKRFGLSLKKRSIQNHHGNASVFLPPIKGFAVKIHVGRFSGDKPIIHPLAPEGQGTRESLFRGFRVKSGRPNKKNPGGGERQKQKNRPPRQRLFQKTSHAEKESKIYAKNLPEFYLIYQ